MGRRAKLKQVRRDIRTAFTSASEGRKATLLKALETRAGLSPEKVLEMLR